MRISYISGHFNIKEFMRRYVRYDAQQCKTLMYSLTGIIRYLFSDSFALLLGAEVDDVLIEPPVIGHVHLKRVGVERNRLSGLPAFARVFVAELRIERGEREEKGPSGRG